MLDNQQLQEQNLQATSMKRAQALVLLSRIYVGNLIFKYIIDNYFSNMFIFFWYAHWFFLNFTGSINYDIREEQIKQLLLPCGPVRSVTMSYDAMTGKHKGFAFLEFETPEAAALALEQMTSAMLGGRQVKVSILIRLRYGLKCLVFFFSLSLLTRNGKFLQWLKIK